MEVIIAIILVAIIVFGVLFLSHRHQARSEKQMKNALMLYEKSCKENCQTTKDVADRFMETSSTQTMSLMDLHKKTLEMLAGEVHD